jgi:hypothetical protein
MRLDLRIPMGLMFTLTGAILTAFGLATRENAVLYAKSDNLDVNLWWGAVLLVFGIAMLVFGRRGQMRTQREEEKQGSGNGDQGTERRGH